MCISYVIDALSFCKWIIDKSHRLTEYLTFFDDEPMYARAFSPLSNNQNYHNYSAARFQFCQENVETRKPLNYLPIYVYTVSIYQNAAFDQKYCLMLCHNCSIMHLSCQFWFVETKMKFRSHLTAISIQYIRLLEATRKLEPFLLNSSFFTRNLPLNKFYSIQFQRKFPRKNISKFLSGYTPSPPPQRTTTCEFSYSLHAKYIPNPIVIAALE